MIEAADGQFTMVDDPLVKLIWIKNEERIDAAQKEPGNRAGGGRGGTDRGRGGGVRPSVPQWHPARSSSAPILICIKRTRDFRCLMRRRQARLRGKVRQRLEV